SSLPHKVCFACLFIFSRAPLVTFSDEATRGSAAASGTVPVPPLPVHYVRLLTVEKPEVCAFYEAEALRGGWIVRQLDRQISTQFNTKGSQPLPILPGPAHLRYAGS